MTLLTLIACAWEPPLNSNGPPQLNAIEGTVVFGGTGEIGPTFITVYSADNPGPPVGTGGPVTFGAVAPWQFTGDGGGLQSAPYGITQLPDGDYLVNSLVDVDNNFSAFSDLLAGGTCGDWAGTHVTDLATLATAPVSVAGGEAQREVTVYVGTQYVTERPAFVFDSETEISLTVAAESPFPPQYRLKSTAVYTALAEDIPIEFGPACAPDPSVTCDSEAACPCDPATLDPCQTALWLYAPDTDGDGLADPYPAELQASNGIDNIFPRVYVEYIEEPLPDFEHEGRMLPERWVGEHFPLLTEITIAKLGGASAADIFPIGVPVPMHELSITMSPVFRHYHADGVMGEDANGPFDLVDLRLPENDPEDVPAGTWKTTVILHTGQTWNLPNDVAVFELPGGGGFDPATQAEHLTFAP